MSTTVTPGAIEELERATIQAHALWRTEQAKAAQGPTLHPDAQPLDVLKLTEVRATPMPTTTAHPGLAEYYRVSDDREGAGLAVERQRFDCGPIVAQHPHLVQHTYVDNSISASGKRKRPAYQQLLADIRAGLVRVLVVWHPDRLHRNPAELEDFIDAVERAGVTILTARAGLLDLNTPIGRLVARLLGSIAKYELEHMIERAKGKQAELARDGKSHGGPRLFGYTAGFKIDPETGSCIVEREALAAQTVIAQLLAGASLRSQCKWLNAEDESAATEGRQPIYGARGKPWSVATLRPYVTRSSLAGVRTHLAGTPDAQSFPATWPAIITMEQHQALVAIFCDPARKKKSTGGTRKHLLTSIARCGVCGGVMAAATESTKASRGKRYGVYRCRQRFCINRLQKRIDGITLAIMGAWLAKQKPSGLVTDPQTDATLRRLSGQAQELERKLKRLKADYDAECLTGPEYKASRDELAAELGKVEQERLRHTQPATVLDDLWGQEDAEELLRALPLARQRAVIAAIGVPVVHRGSRHQDDFSMVTIDWHPRPQV